MELVLVRHARPERVELVDGRADPALDRVGRRQAAAVAAALAVEEVDAVVSSPLLRARQTAEPIAAALGREVEIVDGVAEWDRDASSYIPVEELRRSHPEMWAALTTGDWDALGIDLPAFVDRVVTALEGVATSNPGRRVAVVCHGGVINAWSAHVLGVARTLFFEPEYTSISRFLVARDGRCSLQSLNEAAHLRKA